MKYNLKPIAIQKNSGAAAVKKTIILIISILPVFLIIAPANCTGILITLSVMLLGCLIAGKYNLSYNDNSEKKLLPYAIVTAIAMGILFVNRWMISSKAASIAETVHLPTKTFLVIIGCLLSLCSLFGIINIISVINNTVSCFSKSDNDISDRKFYICYAIILSLCTVLYCALLGSRYVWSDEAYSFGIVKHSYAEIWKITAADVHPPLYYFVLKFLTKPFNYSLLFAKLVSILPYLFILSFGGIQFKKIFGKKIALLFMIFFFLFPFSMRYVVEVRMYSLAAAFVFGNAVYAYRCYREDKKSNWVLFAITGVCSAYTHYFSLVSTGLVYGILFVFLAIKKRKKLLRWCLASLLTVALYIPWLKCFIDQLVYKVNNDYWISKITIQTVIGYFQSVFGVNGSLTVTVLVILAYLLAFIGCIKCKERSAKVICLCMLAVPFGTIALGVLASVAVRPIFVIRYIAPAIPLLAAFLAVAVQKSKLNVVKTYALIISVCIGIIGYSSMYKAESTVTENALDKTLFTKHPNAECVVVNEVPRVSVVLCYYNSDIPVFNGGYWAASPYPNLHPAGEFDASKYSNVIFLAGIGKPLPNEYKNAYRCDYIGRIDACGDLADAYLLTK